MIVPDVNVLVHAFRSDAPQHSVARDYLRGQLARGEDVGLLGVVVSGFLRVATSPALSPRGSAKAAALLALERWLVEPGIELVTPGAGHMRRFQDLVALPVVTHAHVSDAYIAACVMELGGVLLTFDRGFQRFSRLSYTLLA